jgi:hypothetical protein
VEWISDIDEPPLMHRGTSAKGTAVTAPKTTAKEHNMGTEEPERQPTDQPSEEDKASALADLDVADEQSSAVKGGEVKDSHDRYA